MLTDNYKIWVNSILKGNNTSFNNLINIQGDNMGKINLENEEYRSLDMYFGAHSLNKVTTDRVSSIFVGTGKKEQSQEDFSLESIIPDSDLTNNSASVAFSESKYVFTKTFTYIGTENITINEVAFYKSVYSNRFYTICLARQKIEPLTVSTNDVFTVTMVIG